VSELLPSVLLVGVGAFTVAGAIADWDWFMESTRARGFVRLFGRQGARVFYLVLGLLIGGLGLASIR
jgi:hypothetical protein